MNAAGAFLAFSVRKQGYGGKRSRGSGINYPIRHLLVCRTRSNYDGQPSFKKKKRKKSFNVLGFNVVELMLLKIYKHLNEVN